MAASADPELTLVLPAYNEEDRLPACLVEVAEYVERGGRDAEVLLVDDGSTDRTREIASAAAARWPRLRVIGLARNSGKGAAVREGVLAARGRVVAFSDVDLAAPLVQLDDLILDLADADAAILSRALPGARLERRQSRPREAAGKAYAALARMALLRGVPDAHCGLKAFRREPAREAFAAAGERGIMFDIEVLLLVARRGGAISQRPAVWRHDPRSRIRMGPRRAWEVASAIARIKRRHASLVPPAARGPIRPPAL